MAKAVTDLQSALLSIAAKAEAETTRLDAIAAYIEQHPEILEAHPKLKELIEQRPVVRRSP